VKLFFHIGLNLSRVWQQHCTTPFHCFALKTFNQLFYNFSKLFSGILDLFFLKLVMHKATL